MSQVQVYQWEETERRVKSTIDDMRMTDFFYREIWSDSQIDSASFRQPSHKNSISVAGLQCGTVQIANTTVKYGAARQKISEVVTGPNLHVGFCRYFKQTFIGPKRCNVPEFNVICM